MLTIIVALLINASVFSINGIGEDLSVFQTPFIENTTLGQVGFTMNPEYTLLNEAGEYRGVFWTNPLNFSLSVPVVGGFSVTVGNMERLSQNHDIYLQDSSLQIHALGEGGVEEVFAGINKRLGTFDIVATGSYLFGNAWEIWTYSIGGYGLVDTFTYRYRGRIFNFGMKHKFFSVAYEGLSRLRMTKLDEDTLFIDLPERLSVSLTPPIGEWGLGFMYERSFWSEESYKSPHRFRLSAKRGAARFAYFCNPWYIDGVTEHGIDLDFRIPLRNVGSARIGMTIALRQRDGLREFKFAPSLTLVLNELFARRRK
ncbi:MAG: hypothetical protein PVH23_02325 [candidate division WOR-3 bacterium]|jgi:hypothetical protein